MIKFERTYFDRICIKKILASDFKSDKDQIEIFIR